MKPRTLEDLAQLADHARAAKDPMYMTEVEVCDICSATLTAQRLFVDGAILTVDDVRGWAIMCPSCFFSHGKGIRWGAGQLYERTSDEGWLLVAGFPPD